MEWTEVRIGDVLKVSSGGTPSRKKPEYFDGGTIPWIKTGDLKNRFVKEPDEKITQTGLENSSAKLFPSGTVLLAMYGATIGACSILPFEACTNQACAALLPSSDCDSNYLYNYLKSIKPELVNKGVGGAQPNISAGIIKNIKIPLPPLPIQKKIAAILDAADTYRQKTKALIEKYDELTQSLFLEMFGDPVANSNKWDVKTLGSITTKIQSGNTPKGGSKVYVDHGIVFFRSQNVWRNKIVLKDVAHIDSETHSRMKKTSLKFGDILMTKTGRINTENSSLGRAAMFTGDNDSANINGHVYMIRLKEDIMREFVLYILTTKEYREHIRRVCVGGIDKRQINKDHLEDFPIISPPIVLQERFVITLKEIKKQKEFLKSSLKKGEELFHSLLQRAFKGELIN